MNDKYIPYGRQDINQNDIDEVLNVLKSDFLTQGPKVPAFEKSIADYVGANFAVAVNSATSALHIACLALGLSEKDYLWTSPNTFVASANCGIYCGAKVDFVDIDPDTYNLCTVELERKLILAKKKNRLPKILIPVHFAGQSCNMERIKELSLEYGFKIIEDASHAIGGKYKGEPIGRCEYSDITVFSFHPVKIITTAEGGIAITNSKTIAQDLEILRSHGITRNESSMTKISEGDWYYEQTSLGFNYRMTEIQAALGMSQLKRLDEFIAIRHVLQKRYDCLLKDLPIKLPKQSSSSYSALHLYPIKLELQQISKSRKQIFNELRNSGIGINVHYIPVHTQPFYENLGFKLGDFPVAENYYSRAISIPMYSNLTFEMQDKVVTTLKRVLLS